MSMKSKSVSKEEQEEKKLKAKALRLKKEKMRVKAVRNSNKQYATTKSFNNRHNNFAPQRNTRKK